MEIEGFIFDADGVVIDTEGIWDEEAEITLSRRGLRYDRANLKPRLAGKSLEDGTAEIVRFYDLPGDPLALAAERRDTIRGLLCDRVKFVQGFREFHEKVRRRYQTSVATAMDPQCLEAVDQKLGLRALFKGRIFTTECVHGRSKPMPDLFLYAAGEMGAAPSACVVLEDSPNGVLAAGRAGMYCIALSTTFPPAELAAADVIVTGFSQIHIEAIEDALRSRLPCERSNEYDAR